MKSGLSLLFMLPLCGSNASLWIEAITAIATTLIAAMNIVLTIIIFIKNRDDSSQRESQHQRFELVRILILDHNMRKVYDFYDDVSTECKRLLAVCDTKDKQEINSTILEKSREFRLDFITLFNVVDPRLYKELLRITDNLTDGITNVIFDEGINLKHRPKFDEEVSQKISKCRVDFLSVLYGMEPTGDSNVKWNS